MYIYCCECVWVDGAALPSFPSLFISFLCALHLSVQWQQICQNICGCYGDGYKELTWSWLLRERQRERKKEAGRDCEEAGKKQTNRKNMSNCMFAHQGGIFGQKNYVMLF